MKPSAKIVAIAVLSSLAIACTGQPARKGNFTDEALARYAELSDTTILRSSSLPALTNSLTTEFPAETNAAAVNLKSALSAQGIELLPLHGLFTMAVRPDWSNTPSAALIAQLPVEGVEERPWPAGTQTARG